MRVVAADVVLLGAGVTEARARLHVELDNADIGRRATSLEIRQPAHGRIIAPDTLSDGRQHAGFQIAARRGRIQRQRRDDVQLDARILDGARVKRVEQRVGLADAQRRAQDNALAEAGDDRLDAILWAGVLLHAAISTRGCVPV